jgi:hypothetical protein
MVSYLHVRQGDHTTPLLNLTSGQLLTRSSLATMLQQLLVSVGIPHAYSTHSFRIGAATSAAVSDLPAWFIKRLANEKSECFSKYVGGHPKLFESVSAALSTGSGIPAAARGVLGGVGVTGGNDTAPDGQLPL